MTPQEAMRENVKDAWGVIRNRRGQVGPSAARSIRGQYEFILQAYNTPNGQEVGAPERWVLSGAIS